MRNLPIIFHIQLVVPHAYFHFGLLGVAAEGSIFFIKLVPRFLSHPPFILERWPGIFVLRCTTWGTCHHSVMGVHFLYSNGTWVSQSPSFFVLARLPPFCIEVYLEHPANQSTVGVCLFVLTWYPGFPVTLHLFQQGLSPFCIQIIPGLLGHPPFIWHGHLDFVLRCTWSTCHQFTRGVHILYSNGTPGYPCLFWKGLQEFHKKITWASQKPAPKSSVKRLVSKIRLWHVDICRNWKAPWNPNLGFEGSTEARNLPILSRNR